MAHAMVVEKVEFEDIEIPDVPNSQKLIFRQPPRADKNAVLESSILATYTSCAPILCTYPKATIKRWVTMFRYLRSKSDTHDSIYLFMLRYLQSADQKQYR
jgi:hypothetical protein